jgi:FAD binding domain
VADHFRVGRIFIAGDAGHIHSPAGGQGMNTGIGDAVNLAWKLAAVVQGKTAESILDTYESERIVFARALVATTDRVFQYLVGSGVASRIARSVAFPYVFPALLRFRRTRKAQFRVVSQTSIRYRQSALSKGTAGAIHGGDRLPWLDNQDNFKPLGSLHWQIHVYGTAGQTLRSFAATRKLPIHTFTWDSFARSAGFAKDSMYLLRPDGHLSLVGPTQDTQPLESFLSQWKIV